MGVALLSPTNGRPLVPQGTHLLSDGERLWPVVEGIAYLRPKEELRLAVVDALMADRQREAVSLLLTDQDRFSPTAPPDATALDDLLDTAHDLTLRRAMELLNFGPVADYFAYRWCSPTFVGGLRLLELSVAARGGSRVIEYACGIGHFLRELEAMGLHAVGVDIVWAKLWLARQYMGVRGPLVCGDVEAGTVVEPADPCTVFCHDAFYFFERKQRALDHMRRVAAGGTVAVGHVHTRLDQHGVGFAETLDGYRRLTNSPLQDDRAYVSSWYSGGVLPAANGRSGAVAWREATLGSDAETLYFTAAGDGLQLNPLLGSDEVHWPSPGWRQEYQADARATGPYTLTALVSDPLVQRLVSDSRKVGELSPEERQRLYRRQVLLNLPPRW